MLMKRKRVVRGGGASVACFGGLRILRYGQGETYGQGKTADLQNRSALRTVESKPELPNAHGHEFTTPNAPEGSTPEAEATPAVANFRQGSKKDVRKNTNEAGMCMKTHESRTKCPEKSRTFMY